MDLLPSVDQRDMIASVEDFLSSTLSLPQLHERLRTGAEINSAARTQAAGLGLFSLGLPEEAGGAGCPVVEEALVARALGRHLAPVSFLGSVLGARVAHAAGDEALRDAVAEGSVRVAIALPARPGDDVLDVVDLPGAEWLLRTADGALTLSRLDPSVRGEDRESLDPSATLSRLAAAQVGPETASSPELVQLARLLTAAMLVGAAEAVRDAAVGYASSREQFGRPIAVFQAIKHPIADMAVRCEAASSLLLFAALALRDGRPDAHFQVAAAARIAGTTALDNARANVQVHGGMGFTWENDAHLYLTRAHLLTQLFGTPFELRSTMLGSAPAMP